VRFGREMDNGIHATDQFVDQIQVGDIAVNEVDVAGHRVQRRTVASVGERVEHGHRHLRPLAHRVVDEIRTDESGSAGHKQSHTSTLRLRGDSIATMHVPNEESPSLAHTYGARLRGSCPCGDGPHRGWQTR